MLAALQAIREVRILTGRRMRGLSCQSLVRMLSWLVYAKANFRVRSDSFARGSIGTPAGHTVVSRKEPANCGFGIH